MPTNGGPEVKIVVGTQNAPIFPLLSARLPVDEKRTVVTYADTIYIPFKGALTPDLFVHEATHCRQQGFNQAGASNWWDKYLNDSKFRYEQELEAYRAQYSFLKRQTKNRNWLFAELKRLATDLSSPQYGSIVGLINAMHEIRKGV